MNMTTRTKSLLVLMLVSFACLWPVSNAIDCTDIDMLPAVHINDYCYFFGKDTVVYSAAQQTCARIQYNDTANQLVSGRLAVIPSVPLLHTLFNFAQQVAAPNSWVGLLQTDPSAVQPAGGWNWVNAANAPLEAVKDAGVWAADRPNNSGGCQQCGYLYMAMSGLDDETCDCQFGYICQIYAPDIEPSEK